MKLATGEMWQAWGSADLFLVTTCGELDSSGALVMGKGIALEVKQRFPTVPLMVGNIIQYRAVRRDNLYVYGFMDSPNYPAAKLGLFQTKGEWRDTAKLELIELSAAMLKNWLTWHQGAKVHLNFPGIGYGGLSEGAVMPIIGSLPDNVTIWRKA